MQCLDPVRLIEPMIMTGELERCLRMPIKSAGVQQCSARPGRSVIPKSCTVSTISLM